MQSIRRRSPFGELIRRDALGRVLAHGAGAILHAHVGNHLPLVVGRDVVDLVRRRPRASGCPDALPGRSLPPPTCICSVVTDSVFFSSSAYSTMRWTLSPWNFAGQWHCSQVSRAGRRFCTGDGIGRE